MILFEGDLPFDQTVLVFEVCWQEYLHSSMLSLLDVCIRPVLWMKECCQRPLPFHIFRPLSANSNLIVVFMDFNTWKSAMTHQYCSLLKLMCNLSRARIDDLELFSCLNIGPTPSVGVKVQEVVAFASASLVPFLEVDLVIFHSMLREQLIHCFEGFHTVFCTNHALYTQLAASYLF